MRESTMQLLLSLRNWHLTWACHNSDVPRLRLYLSSALRIQRHCLDNPRDLATKMIFHYCPWHRLSNTMKQFRNQPCQLN